jgi:uncharacterized membrane protein
MKSFYFVIVSLLAVPFRLFSAEKIETFPPSLYDKAAIYLNLALFWLGILGLVIVLVLKLREIERRQKIDVRVKAEDMPFLE